MLLTVMTAISIVGVLTLMLATLLIVASRRFYVEEDPRLEQVEEMLPSNNCGGCGFPSCHMFAEALLSNETKPSKCTVGSQQDAELIATFLHVDVGTEVKRVARLACAGGSNVATRQADYKGEQSCAAAAQVAGGGKVCKWGCLGMADCASACTFDAITMDEHDLPHVDEAKCTACGDCVIACPKDLFSLKPVNQHLWVNCKNQEQGDDIQIHCSVACTACGRCAMDAPEQMISMQHNLPLIAYGPSDGFSEPADNKRAIERCPTGAIVWMSDSGKQTKGSKAASILRHSPVPPEDS